MREDGLIGPVEWSIAGRAMPGQEQSGDRGVVLDAGDGAVLLAALDGLGHGSGAAEATERAAKVLAENRGEPLDLLMVLCHRVMTDTRGAAVSLALFAEDAIHWLGVGNVEARLLSAGPAGVTVRATALLTGGIVGYRLPQTLKPQTVPVRAGDLLLMCTDGVLASVCEAIDLSKPTTEITAGVIAEHTRESDDALVLAARSRRTSAESSGLGGRVR
ncbi:MAG TPA: SpoIIE family protein phosphatase [Nocardia sp.]|uniref:SpoIIE family protein phosphatase n=1 Tax=Nocardia TaxID=1817 RepID=UPI002457D18F|nr:MULTISPECIES: SpoIIE family protein phosphatase [Nocardia]HLS77278.1 SpoIIE family protein phosphatase [Nocardia sp.]